MRCGDDDLPVSTGKAPVTTDYSVVEGQVSWSVEGLRYVRIVTTALIRVRVTYAAGRFEEKVEFDVARAETLVLPASVLTVEAKAYTGTADVAWLAATTGSWQPSRLQYNVAVAGSADSDTDASLRPPAAAVGIRVIQRSASGFTLELQRGSTVLARYTESTMPADGAPLGVCDRVVLTTADPVRVVYDLRL